MSSVTMLRLALLALAIAGCMANGPKITDCHPAGKDKSFVQIKNLDVTPYPISFPGSAKMSFDIEIKETIDNFNINVTVFKDLAGAKIFVPCIKNVGSCSYLDVCAKLNERYPDGCPILFPDCKCPFTRSQSKIEDLQVTFPALPAEIAEIASGKFDVTISIHDKQADELIYACSYMQLELR